MVGTFMLIEKKVLDKIMCPGGLTPEQILYFDIETTGFAEYTNLYLIGCIYYDKKRWKLIQLFSEENNEVELLKTFSDLIKGKKYLICYNGISFDLPYLKRKYKKYGLALDITGIEIIDFYKSFFLFKKFLGLEGLKQKNVENYLNIHREDTFSGGELVKWYLTYTKLDSGEHATRNEIYKTLITHNQDDLIGLTELTKLYDFVKYIEKLLDSECLEIDYKFLENKGKIELQLFTGINCPLSREIKACKDEFSCEIFKSDKIRLTVDLINTELKFFYKDYKNYYYLPKEDIVVHKSLATFIEKRNKERATAENCYVTHSGIFLRTPEKLELPVFKKNYSDKFTYALVDDKLLNSKKNLSLLFKSVINYIKN